MIIDFHTHIFTKDIKNNREKLFSSETTFKQLYGKSDSKIICTEELIASMDKNKIDISVVFGFPWKDSEKIKDHNDYIIESVKKNSERLIGFCCVNPFDKEAAAEVKRCVDGGLSGVGEIAFYESGIENETVERLGPVMEICMKKNLPVLIHTNEPVGHYYPGKSPNTIEQIYKMVKKFPENKIILAHWGGGIFIFNLLKQEAKKVFGNVYFDTAASPFLYDHEVYRIAIDIIGKEKILFGSDFPLINPERYFDEFRKAGLTDDEIKYISGLNAARLLGV